VSLARLRKTAASLALVPCKGTTVPSSASVSSSFWRQRRCIPPKIHDVTRQNIANIRDIFNFTDLAKTELQPKTMNSWLSRCGAPIIRHPPPHSRTVCYVYQTFNLHPSFPLPIPSRSNSTITRNRRSINCRSNSFRYSDCVADRGLFKTGHLKLKLPLAIAIQWTRVTNAQQLRVPICSGCEQGRLFVQGAQKVGKCICIYLLCVRSDPVTAVANVTQCSLRHI
jgi:hypothetical protein